tara:strand:- start:607 stop:966 length:360 start_codon:yes stop_codon:yes gene_type:complete
MLPGIEVSTIIEMVLNADRTEEIERILTEGNIRDSQFVKNLLWVATDPNYQEGTDEKLDEILSTNELDSRFLQGLMTGIIIILSAERPFYVNNPNHIILAKLYESAQAMVLERSIGCEE